MGDQLCHEGRIRKITDKLDAAYTTEFTYDHAERLTGATATAYTRGYGFDAWGNLTSVTGSGGPGFQGYTLNYEAGPFGGPATNRILNVNGTLPYTYDAAGNLTAAEGRSYAYDGASRLTSVNSGTLGQYGYDGDGTRVKKVEGGGATYYVRSSVLGQALLEVTSAGVQRAYVYAPNGKLLAQRSTDGQFYWVHTDHLSSGRKLTDASGAVIYRAEFDPHGQVLLEWAASGNTNLNTKKFATYERDAGTGLDYAGARMYANARGRFMQPDPAWLSAASLARPQSLNRYSYVENDPVNFIDPSGNNLIGAFGAFVNVGGLLVPNVGTVATINTSTNAGMMGIPGSTAIVAVEEWVDGSVGIVGGGGDDQFKMIRFGRLEDFEKLFSDMLSRGDCNAFVTSLIDKVADNTGRNAYSNDANKLLDTVLRQGGIQIGQAYSGGQRAGAIPFGHIDQGNAGITITGWYGSLDPSEAYVNSAMLYYAQTALHELIHHAGNSTYYTDYEIAKAQADLGYLSADDFSKLTPDDRFGASGAWDKTLTEHCK